jgi:hypothetical protein
MEKAQPVPSWVRRLREEHSLHSFLHPQAAGREAIFRSASPQERHRNNNGRLHSRRGKSGFSSYEGRGSDSSSSNSKGRRDERRAKRREAAAASPSSPVSASSPSSPPSSAFAPIECLFDEPCYHSHCRFHSDNPGRSTFVSFGKRRI